jgi:chromosome segregation ATPase
MNPDLLTLLTDSARAKTFQDDEAAKLERELTALTAERDQLRNELSTERARLDAVVANCWVVHSEGGSSFSVFSNVCGDYIATAQTYRAAIDAAMKEGAK